MLCVGISCHQLTILSPEIFLINIFVFCQKNLLCDIKNKLPLSSCLMNIAPIVVVITHCLGLVSAKVGWYLGDACVRSVNQFNYPYLLVVAEHVYQASTT